MAETTTTAPAPPPPGVMSGGHLTRIRISDPSSPTGTAFRWYQIYEYPPGSKKFVAYQYNDVNQAIAAHGELPFYRTWSEADFDRVVLAEAKAEEVIGRDTNFQLFTGEIAKEAAQAAGVRDPALLGQMASNPEMQAIMVQAIVGKWTQEQIRAEQRKTNYWQNVLYPGIKNLYGLTQNPEDAYEDYVAQVTPSLQALGYTPDAAGSFKSQIKSMLDKKIDANVFQSQVPTFIRATQNAEFATVLNQWAERDLGRNIGFTDWFDLMAGEAQPDLDQVAERATLEWVAQNQGTQLTQGEVENIAARTQLTPDEAMRAISEFNQGILSLGDEALGRYGLSRDEVLSASVGVSPTSGRTVDEVKLLVAKTAREQGMFDDERINFYVGFNPMGQPTRPGLQTLAPEGA